MEKYGGQVEIYAQEVSYWQAVLDCQSLDLDMLAGAHGRLQVLENATGNKLTLYVVDKINLNETLKVLSQAWSTGTAFLAVHEITSNLVYLYKVGQSLGQGILLRDSESPSTARALQTAISTSQNDKLDLLNSIIHATSLSFENRTDYTLSEVIYFVLYSLLLKSNNSLASKISQLANSSTDLNLFSDAGALARRATRFQTLLSKTDHGLTIDANIFLKYRYIDLVSRLRSNFSENEKGSASKHLISAISIEIVKVIGNRCEEGRVFTIFNPNSVGGELILEICKQMNRNNMKWSKLTCWDESTDNNRITKITTEIVIPLLFPEVNTSTLIENKNLDSTNYPDADILLLNSPSTRSKEYPDAKETIEFSVNHISNQKKVYEFIAFIVPTQFLDSFRHIHLRRILRKTYSLIAVGNFKGFGFLNSTYTEPSILLGISNEKSKNEHIEMFTLSNSASNSNSRETTTISENMLTDRTWSTRFTNGYSIMSSLEKVKLPKLKDLFELSSTTITGYDQAFVIGEEIFSQLPKTERKLFVKSIGPSAIKDGAIIKVNYLFAPKLKNEAITSEKLLIESAPAFYKIHLSKFKEELTQKLNSKASNKKWWELLRFQTTIKEAQPKIIAKKIGYSNFFAFDEIGDLIPINCIQLTIISPRNPAEIDLTDYYYGYIAILNSSFFNQLLEHFCSTLGSSLRLSIQTLAELPIPDLQYLPRSVVKYLHRTGIEISREIKFDNSELNAFVSEAYGIQRTFYNAELKNKIG